MCVCVQTYVLVKDHVGYPGQILGEGEFGVVRKAQFHPPAIAKYPAFLVAVKALKMDSTDAQVKELLREAAITAQFNHENVMSLIGVVTTGRPVLLVLRLCDKGSLRDILRYTFA